MLKPEPIPTGIICNACGMAWEKHKQGRPSKNPRPAVTLEDCVRVLSAELAKRPHPQVWTQMSGSGMASAVGVPLYGNQIGKIS